MSFFSWLNRFLGVRENRGEYRPLVLREPGAPEENTARLKQSVVKNFELIHLRKDPEHLFIGRFFSTVLLIERKLAVLLNRFDPEIEERTFGGKLKVFKDFLDELESGYEIDGVEPEQYRQLLGPLNEIKKIRDCMAHDLTYIWFTLDDLKQTSAYVKKKRPDLHESSFSVKPDTYYGQAMIASFGFVFSVELAYIDHLFEAAI